MLAKWKNNLQVTGSFGPVCQIWSIKLKCMRDSKQQHKLLKVTRNTTNRDKHINEASKQALPTIFSNYHVNTRKICFSNGRFVSMSSIYELRMKFCVIWAKLVKLHKKRPVLTSQFQVSKLQKQLPTVIQIHLDQCANFRLLPLNVCVTVSHNVAFNTINRWKWQKMQ